MRTRRRAEVNIGLPIVNDLVNGYLGLAVNWPEGKVFMDMWELPDGAFNQYFQTCVNELQGDCYNVRVAL